MRIIRALGWCGEIACSIMRLRPVVKSLSGVFAHLASSMFKYTLS